MALSGILFQSKCQPAAIINPWKIYQAIGHAFSRRYRVQRWSCWQDICIYTRSSGSAIFIPLVCKPSQAFIDKLNILHEINIRYWYCQIQNLIHREIPGKQSLSFEIRRMPSVKLKELLSIIAPAIYLWLKKFIKKSLMETLKTRMPGICWV